MLLNFKGKYVKGEIVLYKYEDTTGNNYLFREYYGISQEFIITNELLQLVLTSEEITQAKERLDQFINRERK